MIILYFGGEGSSIIMNYIIIIATPIWKKNNNFGGEGVTLIIYILEP